MKRSPDPQQPHDSTKKSKASTSGTTISPFEETSDIEKLKGAGEALENIEDNANVTSSVTPHLLSNREGNNDGNSANPTECQGSQANSNKEFPTLRSNNDTSNTKMSRRMEKIVAATMPRGSGFGSNNFAFFNGFAIPLQNIGPSLPTPLSQVVRPQFGYQMNGNFSFPRPQSKQQQVQSTVAASIIRNSVRNNHHVNNPTVTYSCRNTKNATTAFSFSQPWSTQALLNLNQTTTQMQRNSNQNSSQFMQHESTKSRATKHHSGCRKVHEVGNEESTSWKRIFQCCHCNSTNVREILIRNHNYSQNTGDGLRTMKTLTPGSKFGEENPVEKRNSGEGEENLSYKGGVKRKRGYGIQDDYVLNGKFVDADGNQSTDNEHENGDENSPSKKRFAFNSIFTQEKRDGNYYSFGDTLLPSGETPVVNSFRLENSTSKSPSKVFNGRFGGIGCTQGCSKFGIGSQKSQQFINSESSNLSSHVKLVTNSNKNATSFSNIPFNNNSPIRFQTFEQVKHSVSKEEMARKNQEKLSPLNTSMSSVQLSSSNTTSTKATTNAPSSSCTLSTSTFNVGIPNHNTQTFNSNIKNFPVGVLHGTAPSFSSIYNTNNSIVHSPFSFGSNSNRISISATNNQSLMNTSKQQYESLVKPIMFLNGNPLDGFSSARSQPIFESDSMNNTTQASTSTIPPQQQRFSQFLPQLTNPSVPSTFNFFGPSRGQQNGENTLFQFHGQVNSQVSRTGILRKSPRRIKKGIRRLKRK